MPPLHQPLPLSDATLSDLSPFETAGAIELEYGRIAYLRTELEQYWLLRSQENHRPRILVSPEHDLNFLAHVRVTGRLYSVLFFSGGPGQLPPSSAMPYVISLLSDETSSVQRSYVAIFSTDSNPRDQRIENTVDFVISRIVLPQRGWSLSSLARDFGVDNTAISSSGYGLLISDAFNSNMIKHSYLDLFRCIEHRALISTQLDFNREFLDDPKVSTAKLQKSVSSERELYSQTLSTQSAVLSGARGVMNSACSSNRFLTAIINRIENLSSDSGKSASEILYSVRNSIAHAKSGDLMIERFADYEAALELLIPYVEIVALRFAGIELDAALV